VSSGVAARKRELRLRARRDLRLEPHACAASSERAAAIEARVRALPAYECASCVALYAALPGEVPTAALLADLWSRGRSVALPRIDGALLELHVVASGEDLVDGPFGLREPRADRGRVAPDRVDLFLVPGVYFDRRGRRLGRGRGDYDRLLARARGDALRVGLCFSERLIEDVPSAPWDEPMDMVVTELEAIRSDRPGEAR
jgi:5-formyltetrahydrofolate cyclo-ligase